MSGKARQDRDEAEVQFIGVRRGLLHACETTPTSKRAITRKIAELEGTWKKLLKCHTLFCKAASIGLGSAESSEFIDKHANLKEEALFTAENLIGGNEEEDLSIVGKRLQKSVELLIAEVEFTLPTLTGFTTDKLELEAHGEALNMVQEATDKMKRYVELCDKAEEALEATIGATLREKVTKSYKEHGTKLVEIKRLILKNTPAKTSESPKYIPVGEEDGRSLDGRGFVTRKEPLKIKPLDCPTWDGKFRTFARFKLLWQENITPRHEESALHMMLCQALPKFVLDNISTLTSTASEIWAILDEKYGKSEVVAKEVMRELIALDPKKLGNKFMGKFCTCLVDTHSLLASLGEEDWLTTNRAVNELENKLPRDEKMKWAEAYSYISGETRFEKFKSFLEARKKVLETMEAMCTVEEVIKCTYCNKNNHTEESCFAKQKNQGRGKDTGKYRCKICNSPDHWKNECPDRGSDKDRKYKGSSNHGKNNDGIAVGVKVASNTLRPLDCSRCKYSSRLSSCAGCKKSSNINHCLLHCPTYNSMSLTDKVTVVKNSMSCAVCLHPSHTSDRCDFKDKDQNICGMDGCKSHHHPSLHGSQDIYVAGVNVLWLQQEKEVAIDTPAGCFQIKDWFQRQQFTQDSFPVAFKNRCEEIDDLKLELAKPMISGDKVLMTIMHLPIVYGVKREETTLVGFFDDGSNCSIIRYNLAEELGLWGETVTLDLGTINARNTVVTKLYCVELLDIYGNKHTIRAFGLEKISGSLSIVDISAVKSEFSVHVQANWNKLERPHSCEIDLLIGSEVANLHPVTYETRGRMVVKSSIFGSGYVLNGAHEDIKCSQTDFDQNIQIIRSGCYSSNKVSFTQNLGFNSVEEYTQLKTEKEFLLGEDLGCEPPRRCLKCKGCKDCRFRSTHMSPKEALELEIMENGMQFDETIKKWRVKYPFLKDPNVLSNNFSRVLKMQEKTERKIAQAGLVDSCNEVFENMVKLGALSEIGHAELHTWKGPTHYLPIQVVIHPHSVTTPYRLVTNSSLADPETGLSLNSILAKGPMALNDTWDITIRFRHGEYGLSADISKAYYQMKTGVLEKHCRRVLWRYGQVGTPWRIFGFEVVSMGDCCAACLMELIKRGTCEKFQNIDPVASKKIIDNSFVDDISLARSKTECLRFKGNMDPYTCLTDGSISQILKAGGFEVKAIAVSLEPDGIALEKLGRSVLGLGFSTASDLLKVHFKVNITPHKNGQTTGPDLNKSTLHQLESAVITKRVCLRIASSQYDPLGVASPLIIILKVKMRELYSMGIDWDTPLHGDIRDSWIRMIKMLVTAEGLEFRRSTRPEGSVGECTLISYFDGSDSAFAVVIYARWEMVDGSVTVNFVASKARVRPLFATSTFRMEMNGATLVSRVTMRVVVALMDNPPHKIFFLGDSETVLASRERESGFFGEYCGNRIGEQFDNQEIIEKIAKVGEAGEWYHVSGKDNAADRATRLNSLPEDLGLNSDWQNGPPYLKLPVKKWPINRNFADRKNKIKYPVKEVRRKYRNKLGDHGELLLGTEVSKVSSLLPGGPGCKLNTIVEHFNHGLNTNSWEKLVCSTSYLFRWLATTQCGPEQSIEVVAREMAIRFWIRVEMPHTNQAAVEGRLKHLSPFQHGKYSDMLVVSGRAAPGLKQYFQKDYLPILMGKTRIAYLIMLWAHEIDHAGVDTTLQTSLQVAWIVGGRALARGIKMSCVRCRFLSKKLEGQQMATLPAQLLVPAPCFSFVAVDLAGPFWCKREGASRATRRNTGRMKVWAVLIVCLQTKAVKIYIAGGLSTSDFLLVWDEFVADHGQPAIAYSDRGTNLVSAAKESKSVDMPNYEWDKIVETTRGKT